MRNSYYIDSNDTQAISVVSMSVLTHPLLARYLAAGLVLAMLPAGEIWSVVTESPKFSSA